MGKAAKIGIAVVVLAIVGQIMESSAPAPTPEQVAADSTREVQRERDRQDREQMRTAQAMMKAVLKDPESAQFSEVMVVRVSGEPVVCGYVNARNGFGGFTGRKGFLVTAGGRLTTEESAEGAFEKDWNRLCAGASR